MPKDNNTSPIPTVGHHTEDGSYVETPAIRRGSMQEPPVNSLPEPSTSNDTTPKTVDPKANTYTPQMPDEIREQSKQDLLRQIREASKYKLFNDQDQEQASSNMPSPSSSYAQTQAQDQSNDGHKKPHGRKKPKKDHSKLIKIVVVSGFIVASLIIIVGVGMALTRQNNNLPPLITPKQEQYIEKPKPVADVTPQKTARIYADGEGKDTLNKVEHILASPEQPLSLEEIKNGKRKITQVNAPDTQGVNSHIKDSHGFENEALSNSKRKSINKETTQTLQAHAQKYQSPATKTANPSNATAKVTQKAPVPAKVAPKVAVKPTVTSKLTPTPATNPAITSKATPIPATKPVVNNKLTSSTVTKTPATNKLTSTPATQPATANKLTSAPATQPATANKPIATAHQPNYKWEVQLVATKSQRLAEISWKKAVAQAPAVLTTTPVYRKVIVNKNSYVRLRTGNFKTRQLAAEFCVKLKTHGLDCSPNLKK